jgi:hypothetical protein
MRDERSASQILFGFLPEQTADLKGRIWKVRDWRNPVLRQIDDATLRRELVRAAMPWKMTGLDASYVDHLLQRRDLAVYAVDRDHGINVEEFPLVWICRSGACNRVYSNKRPPKCGCGSDAFGQLPFVGYHSCGELRQPWVPTCNQHRAVAIRLPGTASAAEIVFYCPVCRQELRRGWGFTPCVCGRGTGGDQNIRFNVHRASPVYAPQTFVLVNAPSAERTRQLNEAGGPLRALGWAVRGFDKSRPEESGWTTEALIRDLVGKGFSEAVARGMAQHAAEGGQLIGKDEFGSIDDEARDRAAAEAVTVALAMDQSRINVSELIQRAGDVGGTRATVYRRDYCVALERAGLDAVELVEKFPVMTGAFGFTRTSSTPGQSQLRPFKRDKRYVVYADISETEALFFRLRPTWVLEWLRGLGYALPSADDERAARLAILAAGRIPERGDEPSTRHPGVDVLTLVHSFAHRVMRRLAVFAGIDRNALSELVVSHHLGFFVYAAARGDFVLGGLQAVFEGELHHALHDVVGGDTRCPLDPGCGRAAGACMACLHVGEPSCRYYNRFLSRSVLFGANGYVSASATRKPSL